MAFAAHKPICCMFVSLMPMQQMNLQVKQQQMAYTVAVMLICDSR